MAASSLSQSALVLVDLQRFILDLDLQPTSGVDIVARGAELARACRAANRPVFYLQVMLSELVHHKVDRPLMDPTQPPPPEEASELAPEAGYQDGDTLVAKRHWGAFQSTELDLLLRRRGIDTIILAGAVTNFGVESTARMAFDLGYNLVFASDAITGVDHELHEAAIFGVFPFMGRVLKIEAIETELAA